MNPLRGFLIGLLLVDALIYTQFHLGMTLVWLLLAIAVYMEWRLTR